MEGRSSVKKSDLLARNITSMEGKNIAKKSDLLPRNITSLDGTTKSGSSGYDIDLTDIHSLSQAMLSCNDVSSVSTDILLRRDDPYL